MANITYSQRIEMRDAIGKDGKPTKMPQEIVVREKRVNGRIMETREILWGRDYKNEQLLRKEKDKLDGKTTNHGRNINLLFAATQKQKIEMQRNKIYTIERLLLTPKDQLEFLGDDAERLIDAAKAYVKENPDTESAAISETESLRNQVDELRELLLQVADEKLGGGDGDATVPVEQLDATVSELEEAKKENAALKAKLADTEKLKEADTSKEGKANTKTTK